MNFRQMRLIVIYDLPTTTKTSQRQASKFRSFLINLGFVMMQESVYVKHCLHYDALNKTLIRIDKNKPEAGDVRCISITEKQYEAIVFIKGSKSFREKQLSNDSLVLI